MFLFFFFFFLIDKDFQCIYGYGDIWMPDSSVSWVSLLPVSENMIPDMVLGLGGSASTVIIPVMSGYVVSENSKTPA